MSFTIAVSGKGGTGKTTFAGMIVRYLLEKEKGPVLALDADANTNLNEVLGMKVTATIGEARELMKKDVPVGMTKDVWFEYKVHEALMEGKGFDLLAMGRPEGSGCYCAANTLARKSLDLLTENYSYVVIDNEAGMEHFSRMTTRDVNLLFILSDSSRRSIMSAGRIRDLIGELQLRVDRSVLVVNRVPGGKFEQGIAEAIRANSLEFGGIIPEDNGVYQFDLAGRPTFDLPAESSAWEAARLILGRYIN
ncbi:MAG: AAA family ATPase [Smithellaceae bacterium]|nr:AAA family ATPase [Smithellaceae bacterium]